MPDKFAATWVSHSSISDFLNCPRLYYLRHIFKNPQTGHKINRIEPALALGFIVHETIESLSTLPVDQRFLIRPTKKYESLWPQVSGKLGGFKDKSQEDEYYERGLIMIKKVEENPGPLANKAIKLKSDNDIDLPSYTFSQEDNIILCGKVDWIEYLPANDSLHILDFKSGRREEDSDSLQLPIYYLIVKNTQNRQIEKISYWYLEFNDAPTTIDLPNDAEVYKKIYDVAKRIKLARQLSHFPCKEKDGCKYCSAMEQISLGKGELVSQSSWQDTFVI
jgi:ATP-dependent helicase/DNAse subunit B